MLSQLGLHLCCFSEPRLHAAHNLLPPTTVQVAAQHAAAAAAEEQQRQQEAERRETRAKLQVGWLAVNSVIVNR
jgi:hypothetical protein